MNIENFPGGMISGVDDSLIDFFMAESTCSSRYVTELSSNFTKQMEAIEDCEDLSEKDQKQLTELEKESIPRSTQQQTDQHILKLKTFLTEKGLCPNIEQVPDTVLCDYLRLFYSELRTEKGEFYSPSSLICFRASIQRFLTSPGINRLIDIINGNDFKRANGVLRAMVGKYLKSTQTKATQYEAINEDDMTKITQYFKRNDLKVLQDEITFNCIYYFGLRGRENLRSLKYSSFEVKTDDSGSKYVCIATPMLQKNVKASLNSKEYADTKQARMYEVSNEDICPVQILSI